MPNYQYEAADQVSGKLSQGQIDAESERNARQQLRAKGLIPLKITPGQTSRSALSPGRARLRSSELGWLTRQFANLLDAGLTLEATLTAALEQADRKPVAHMLAAIRADVRAGHRLSDALSAHPKEFPAIYRGLIEAGESSGELPKVMSRLANYLDSRHATQNKLVTALIYPALVTMVALVMVLFLLTHVVPQVVGAFTQTQQRLPWATEVLLGVSHYVQHWGWQSALVILAGMLATRLLLRDPRARRRWDTKLLGLPVLGRYIQEVNTERFASTLAILVGSGVPLLMALESSRKTLTNTQLQAAIGDTTERVRQGSTLYSALQAQKAFPPILVHLVESGERTGQLPELLERAAITLSSEVQQRTSRLAAVLEPLATLIMGALVLFIVLAIMLPIIEINQLVQ
ncbi:type II secretion system inner membrane protein GspF [Orrella marina]|uniref:General secretion pathway protein F n=1 Tax=Orrella marina TaxID=2163011 RepID=A0A2R4XKT1_9BURK|nr:type II secretion system inner membrane protein GspF [Orrella marina]AWB34407.1 type II secretion system protein GspF [Orrella marina]